MQELWQGLFGGPPGELTKHGADANEDQIADSQNDGEFDERDGDAKENAKDAQSYASSGQNEGDAHSQNKNTQQDNSHYS
jgi:hypothetical protein